MKGLRQRLEEIFVALSFAETGEHEKAREILKETIFAKGVESDHSVCSMMPLTLKGTKP